MLTVYRASAGSGKTFQLTLEYLKLLFASDRAYLHILAVTFTNKATEEMKRRVIDELNILAHAVRKSPYIACLGEHLALSDVDIQLRARGLLQTLLHDFSGFNISTIDRFFQQATRAFTREIGLQGGYNLELDSSHVLSQAIDNMLFRLEDSENKDLLQWLLQFSGEKVESGQGWDIRRDIGALSKEIFNEQYKTYRQDILALTADKKVLTAYLREMHRLRDRFEEALREIAALGVSQMALSGLSPDDFKGSSRSPFFWFDRWAKGSVDRPKSSFTLLLDNPEGWRTKKSERGSEIDAVYPQLNETIRGILACFETYPLYQSAVETARYIYTLGILSDIDRYVQQYQQEHNLLLLSDTTELLNKIIDGSDTPFVYEKIGTRIDHYMIDEFQDTSRMQWRNFFPLFNESLDKDRDCLIVGDVKQSIYRWRNSDWKLLSEQIAVEFKAYQRQDAVLDTNWRSCARIIAFNNSFFTRAAAFLQQQFNDQSSDGYLAPADRERLGTLITHAYADICQQTPESARKKGGHVKLSFIEEGNSDWTEQVLGQLPEMLMKLQDNGYLLKDIALLVRSKSEGALLADFLLQYKAERPADNRYRFDIISDEALFLANSPFVKLMIRLLNYLYRPEEELNRILAAYEYYLSHGKLDAAPALNTCFEKRVEEPSRLFPADVEMALDAIRTLPLFEMCEKLVALFPFFDSKEGAFVQAFQDLVLAFTVRNSADIGSFLRWWDEQGCTKTISTPDSQDAIRIITVHKSKGLAFNVVIVPFCNWEIDHSAVHSNILWSRTQQKPFNRLPLVPVRYSSRLEQTVYASDYFTEKIHAYIDNLNLAYVAFTRAREELILFAPRPGNKLTLASLLATCIGGDFSGAVPDAEPGGWYDDATGVYESGEWWRTESVRLEGASELTMPEYRSVDPGERLQLKLFSQGFFGNNGERRYGTLMHDILSRIQTSDDIDEAVQRGVLSGELSDSDAAPIVQKLKAWTSYSETNRWFDRECRILNEVEILRNDKRLMRPDRVVLFAETVEVIDYKFGNVERKSHVTQVEHYMEAIREMGYISVKGFVWYVEMNKIVPVE